jgi:hypothetical protein
MHTGNWSPARTTGKGVGKMEDLAGLRPSKAGMFVETLRAMELLAEREGPTTLLTELRRSGFSSLRIAFPDPVLKYLSSSLAFLSVLTATNATISSGRYAFVDCTEPSLCSRNRRAKSSV